jgi:ribosomal protein L13
VRTYTPKPGDINRQWHVIDATDVVLGRLASQTATLLRGKHKPTFAPHMDMGDFVIIINAEKVACWRRTRFAQLRRQSAACCPRTPWLPSSWAS